MISFVMPLCLFDDCGVRCEIFFQKCFEFKYPLDESRKKVRIMLFQLILDIIVFILKMVLWVVMGLVAIPFGIYMLLQHLLPIFTHEASFWFWALFAACTMVAYYVLWKPLLWIVGVVSVLGAGQ